MAWQGVAMASFLGGIAGLALTGAAPRTVPIFIPLTAAGAGLFGTTWLADVHGVTMPPGARGESRRAPPRIEAEAGMRYVHDRVLPYRAFLVAALDWRLGGFRLAPSAWVAVDHGNARLRAAGAYRLAGPRPRAADAGPAPPAAADGSYLDLEVALTHHRYGSERFALTLGEAALAGRLDLARIAASLAGSFAEVGVGLAFGGITYFDVTTEATDLLLGRFAWGLYLGREADRWAELSIYYDHRHDGFAGGLKLPGLGSGSAGHFGARALAYLGPRWGFLVDLQAGSAYVAGASVMLRHGGGA
jgi:hypothetical protein